MSVSREQQLISRLRISELTIEKAVQTLDQIAEIPAMQAEIDRRIQQAAVLASQLRKLMQEQQRDYPTPAPEDPTKEESDAL